MRVPVITGSYKQFRYFAERRKMEGDDYFYCDRDEKLLGDTYDKIVLTGDWWNTQVSIKLAESCLTKNGTLKEVRLL